MHESEGKMRIHRYRGRENGLMIIGSKDELIRLGRALAAASPAIARVDPNEWPPQVAAFKPLSADGQFTVSFHLETVSEKKPDTNFPDKV